MLPRFRSLYSKFIIFISVVICCVIYLRVQLGDDGNSILGESSRHYVNHQQLRQQQQLEQMGVQEQPALHESDSAEDENNANEIVEYNDDTELKNHKEDLVPKTEMPPYELSIRWDLVKQEPGLGDKGEAAYLVGSAKERGEQIYSKIALNEELSEHMSYNRTLKDNRHPACRSLRYDIKTLPTTSVIIIFFNEPYSVLLRTVHSTFNTCKGRLLKEVVLVDDGSTNMELGGKLDYYIKTRLPPDQVKVVRLKNRLGLIRARLAGARAATGDVLIFLDAHCEANIGWCEPLLARIQESRTSVLVPIIDVIDAKDFTYSTNGYRSFQIGGFHWSGHFDWINVSEREKKRQIRECRVMREICPTHNPTMAGGLFAIDRNYFWESGSYDEQMDGWGGENLEMSFRIWQCGGTIETIPCSRVGHIFRDFHPYKFPNDRDTHGLNTARMALVWMDEYINLLYLHRPDLKNNPEVGDVTHRIMLRKKLRCKSFDWYMKNVYPEKFIPNVNVKGWGKVKNVATNLCFDDLQQKDDAPFNLGVYTCSKTLSKPQFLSYSNNRVLRSEESCATIQESSSPPYFVVMTPCLPRDEFNEEWEYSNEHLIHDGTGLCLDVHGLKSMDRLQARICDPDSETQRWIFEQ